MFANRLKLLRNEKNLTQAEFAKVINVAPSTIGMYERGSREPNIDTIKIIANFFNVSSDYLIGLTDIREKYNDILNKKDITSIIEYIPKEAKKRVRGIFIIYRI